ncbi:MAG: DUF4340 domain-containing protein [Bacteroidota bacterium]
MKNKFLIGVFLIVAGVALFTVYTKKSSTIVGDLHDFAVSDTAAIDKIFLVDRDGNRSLLTRVDSGHWIVNGKHKARKESIDNLLETIRNIEVKSPVGKNLYNNTMKLMASKSVKVEIYQKGSIVKTYYVGHPTMDNLGTFMYIEKSTVPYIMHIPGFNGFLSTRYITKEDDWRERYVFHFDPRTIVAVNILNTTKQDRSFSLTRNADSTYALTYTKLGAKPESYDIVKLRKYLDVFSNTNFERIDNTLGKVQADSILKTTPFAVIAVTDDRNYTKTVQLYRKPVTASSRNQIDEVSGKPLQFDIDRFYARVEGSEDWFICQYFHFDRLMITPEVLMPGKPDKATENRY